MSTKRINRPRRGHSLFVALAVIAALLIAVMSALQPGAPDDHDGRLAAGRAASANAVDHAVHGQVSASDKGAAAR
jgi:hypothetical protein